VLLEDFEVSDTSSPRRAGSDRLVARLYQDLVDGHMLGLPEGVYDRRSYVLGVQQTRTIGWRVTLHRFRIAAQLVQVSGDVARLDGGYLDPRAGRLQAQPLRQPFNEEKSLFTFQRRL
jgi:hypothetical protein